MMFTTAGLLILNLGLLAQALALVPQHEGSGDVTGHYKIFNICFFLPW
jgi:hypothetical protein